MIDRLINVLVTITLIEMMVTIGLSVTFIDLAGIARDRVTVSQCSPRLAARLQRPANPVSKVLNLVVVGMILVAQFH